MSVLKSGFAQVAALVAAGALILGVGYVGLTGFKKHKVAKAGVPVQLPIDLPDDLQSLDQSSAIDVTVVPPETGATAIVKLRFPNEAEAVEVGRFSVLSPDGYKSSDKPQRFRLGLRQALQKLHQKFENKIDKLKSLGHEAQIEIEIVDPLGKPLADGKTLTVDDAKVVKP